MRVGKEDLAAGLMGLKPQLSSAVFMSRWVSEPTEIAMKHHNTIEIRTNSALRSDWKWVSLCSARAATIGETGVLPPADGDDGNLLLAKSKALRA
jgi:hypothetical protein